MNKKDYEILIADLKKTSSEYIQKYSEGKIGAYFLSVKLAEIRREMDKLNSTKVIYE